jgi:hypothetical protein
MSGVIASGATCSYRTSVIDATAFVGMDGEPQAVAADAMQTALTLRTKAARRCLILKSPVGAQRTESYVSTRTVLTAIFANC